MRMLTTVVLSVLTLTSASMATVGDMDLLATRALTVYEQFEQIRSDMAERVGALPEEGRAVDQVIRAFDEPALADDERIALDGKIDRERDRLARLEERAGNDPGRINRTRAKIIELQLLRELGELNAASERLDFRDDLEARSAAIRAQIIDIERPFRDRMHAISSGSTADSERFSRELKPYFLPPSDAFSGVVPDNVRFTTHMAFGSVEWFDDAGEKVAWAHIRLRRDSEVTTLDRNDLLDGRYPVRTLSNDSIWLWAGNFLVTFVAVDPALEHKDALRAAVGDFVDLQGLAEINISDADAFAASGEKR